MTEILSFLFGLAPVFVFLVALTYLDSFKLVTLRSVLLSISAGCAAAVICLFVNGWLLQILGTDKVILTRYVAPVVEELMKGLYIIYLIRTGRTGFLVDAAIFGFAVGAGFALVENTYYFGVISDNTIFLWIVRGFGTATLHGSTTAIYAIISKTLSDRYDRRTPLVFIPGMVVVVVIHSSFNHFVLSPALSTLLIMVTLPILIIVVFERSRRMTLEWLGTGWEADVELLEAINSDDITQTPIGKYLSRVRKRFPGEVVADMLCLLRINAELSLAAKGHMLARQAGLVSPLDPEVSEKLVELKYLGDKIGITGKLAVQPFLRVKNPDQWQIRLLK